MSTQVPFQNAVTGEIKMVKVGFSWTLFLFGGFFGLPAFMRGLNSWGVRLLLVALLLGPVVLAFTIYLGVKGNELTAKNYLEKGWRFAEPDSLATTQGLQKWGWAATPQAQTQSLEQESQLPHGS